MSMTTRREMIEQLTSFMGERGDDDAQSDAEQLLHRVMMTIWLKWPFSDHILPTPYEFTTQANVRSYVLPPHFGRVPPGRQVRNVSLACRPLEPISSHDLEDRHPEAGTSLEQAGRPLFYVIEGTQAVSMQPNPAGEALEVISSSAADTVTVQAVIEGLDGNGVWTRVVASITGTVAVPVGTWKQVSAFSKGYQDSSDPATRLMSSVGAVTLQKAAGGAVLDTLQPFESSHQRKIITLFRKPDIAYVMSVPILRLPAPLVHDSDALPDAWGPAIFEEARIEWDVNQGGLAVAEAGSVPRPQFKALVEYDSSQTPLMQRQAFMG